MKPRLSVSPAAVVLWGLVLYLADWRSLKALLPPILIHELGHAAAAQAFHMKLLSLRLEPGGLCLHYAGLSSPRQDALTAAAGPFAGLLYALAVRGLGQEGALSAGISLLLSLFNLIPARPLDGSVIANALLQPDAASLLGQAAAAAVWLAGLALLLSGRGAALLFSGSLLLCYAFGAALS